MSVESVVNLAVVNPTVVEVVDRRMIWKSRRGLPEACTLSPVHDQAQPLLEPTACFDDSE